MCTIFQENIFSCYILLIDQISLFDCLYLCYAICVLELFVTQVVMLYIWKLTLSIQSSHFFTWRKSQDRNLNILRTKGAFQGKKKFFFSSFSEGSQLPKIVSDLRVRFYWCDLRVRVTGILTSASLDRFLWNFVFIGVIFLETLQKIFIFGAQNIYKPLPILLRIVTWREICLGGMRGFWPPISADLSMNWKNTT